MELTGLKKVSFPLRAKQALRICFSEGKEINFERNYPKWRMSERAGATPELLFKTKLPGGAIFLPALVPAFLLSSPLPAGFIFQNR